MENFYLKVLSTKPASITQQYESIVTKWFSTLFGESQVPPSRHTRNCFLSVTCSLGSLLRVRELHSTILVWHKVFTQRNEWGSKSLRYEASKWPCQRQIYKFHRELANGQEFRKMKVIGYVQGPTSKWHLIPYPFLFMGWSEGSLQEATNSSVRAIWFKHSVPRFRKVRKGISQFLEWLRCKELW